MSQHTQASQQNSQDSYTERQFQRKFFAMGARCYYCSAPLLLKDAHREHRTPRCRGGSDLIPNIVPACATCNQMKGWRTEAEFLKERPALLAQSAQTTRSIDKSELHAAPEVTHNEPGLLKKLINERDGQLSWAWRNPA